MSIGINGQYIIKFDIGYSTRFQDFIREEELISFKIVEETGNVLPTFELIFNTVREDLFSVLHESNDILVSYGADLNNLLISKLTAMSKKSKKVSDGKILIVLRGFYSAIKYINNTKIVLNDKKSAIEVINEVAKSTFGVSSVVSNVSHSIDKQVWIQNNISDKKFINECWMHSDLGKSFASIGITSSGKFIIKDIIKDISSGESNILWKFTQNPQDPKDILIDGPPDVEENSGFINNWVGYGREMDVVNLEDSLADEPIVEEMKPIMALTSRISKRIEIENKYASIGIINENTHANYWKSYLANLTRLASMYNIKLTVTFHNVFKDVKVLDKVYFQEPNIAGTGYSEFTSGVYFVAKVARVFTNRQFNTNVVICRESMNSMVSTQ